MALVSPGVQVTIVDESNYLPAATNSVPYFLIATAQDKVSGSGVGVAAGTLKANANRAYLITSQRDLTATFGNPFFYKTTIGTPINGYELNEYGLLAAYSALGVTNRAYIQRCDIDLTQLTASLVRPTGEPNNGAYWFDIADTQWGIFEWNSVTNTFSNMVPSVITDTAYLDGSGVPLKSYGTIGNYAVVTVGDYGQFNPVYYKNGAAKNTQTSSSHLANLYNSWVLVGSNDWQVSYPTITGANAVTNDLTAGNTLVINGTSVAVPVSPNNDIVGLSAAINIEGITGVHSAVIDNKLAIFADATSNFSGTTQNNGIVVIGSGSTSGLLTTLGLTASVTYYAPTLLASNNYENPNWSSTGASPRPTGSVWNKTNNVNLGTNMVVKKYSTALAAFVQQSAVVYQDDWEANANLDATGGGKNIPAGSTYTQYNPQPVLNNNETDNYPFNPTYTLQLFERNQLGSTVITGSVADPTFTNGQQFYIMTSQANSTALTAPVLATINTSINGTGPAAFTTAISGANVPNVSASVDSNGYIVLKQDIGGVILLQDTNATDPVATAGFNTDVTGCRTVYYGTNATAATDTWLQLSNWVALNYTPSAVAPGQDPATGRYWYYSATNQVDIMIQTGSGWAGYLNGGTDIRGDNLGATNATGPQISATAPTTQSNGNPLAYGDLWIDTSNLELYPVINRWSVVNGVDQWITLDNADQTTQNGVLFADARWSSTGTANPITDPLPTITSLLSSNYLDIDAPDYTLYPTGMLLFNTRRSGFNVKSFQANYFNASTFAYPTWSSTTAYAVGDQVLYNTTLYVAIQSSTDELPTNANYWSDLQVNSWVTASGNRNDGSPNMGRFAQRALIVAALKSGIDTSVTIREEQVQFNLSACTAYPELIPNMLALSNERNNTVFVVGDTPMRLPANGTDIVNWATNNAGAGYITGDGLTSNSPYVGVFWPSCQTVDLSGSAVVTAPSHMMVRTIIRNDEVAYPWLAPAGTRRGVVDNADRIGYINGQTGEFITLGVNQGLRDVLYQNNVNPITFIPGVGITNFGNKTTQAIATSLDRINVARLIVFIRARLEEIGKQFLFEPNDQITRDEVRNSVNSLMINLVAKRGIYDYLVVCDDTNNTPARIDANELWVDIAIEPTKAVEFIYIPIRLKNTGEIAAGSVASAQAV
jgi:hypothetical protein